MVHFGECAQWLRAQKVVIKRAAKPDVTVHVRGKRVAIEVHGALHSWVFPKVLSAAACRRLATHCCTDKRWDAYDMARCSRSIVELVEHLLTCGAEHVFLITEGRAAAKAPTHQARQESREEAFQNKTFKSAYTVPDCLIKDIAERLPDSDTVTWVDVPGEAEATACAMSRDGKIDTYLNFSGDWDVLGFPGAKMVIFRPSLSGFGGRSPKVLGTAIDLSTLGPMLTAPESKKTRAEYDMGTWKGNKAMAVVTLQNIIGSDYFDGVYNVAMAGALTHVDPVARSHCGSPLGFAARVAQKLRVNRLDFVAACAAMYYAPVNTDGVGGTYAPLCSCSCRQQKHSKACAVTELASLLTEAKAERKKVATAVFSQILDIGDWRPAPHSSYSHFGRCKSGLCGDPHDELTIKGVGGREADIPRDVAFERAKWTELPPLPYTLLWDYLLGKCKETALADKFYSRGFRYAVQARRTMDESLKVVFNPSARLLFVKVKTPQSQNRTDGYDVVIMARLASRDGTAVEEVLFCMCVCCRRHGFVLCHHRTTALAAWRWATIEHRVGGGTTDKSSYYEGKALPDGPAVPLYKCVPDNRVSADDLERGEVEHARRHAEAAVGERFRDVRKIGEETLTFPPDKLRALEGLHGFHTGLTRRRDFESDPEFAQDMESRSRTSSPRQFPWYYDFEPAEPKGTRKRAGGEHAERRRAKPAKPAKRSRK